jgi:hypothetical protein
MSVIACAFCWEKITLDESILYNDLNLCTSCNKNRIERSKRKPKEEKEDPPKKKKK